MLAPAARGCTSTPRPRPWGLAELFLFHGKMSGVGIASLLAVRQRPRLGIDDSLDVFAVHGVAATLGALLTGLLASKAVNPAGADGSLALMGWQAVGVAATLAWSGGLSFVLYKVVGFVFPLRGDEQDEGSGMDAAESGERGYIHAEMESTTSGTVG